MLFGIPYFRGRDRLIGGLAKSFKPQVRRVSSGLSMLLDLEEANQLQIAVDGATEPKTIGLIRQLVSDGDVVIDVGAHVGQLALEAARSAGANGRVFAFDPQPYNADRTAANASINGLHNIVSICSALGPRNDTIRIPLQSFRDRSRLTVALSTIPRDAVQVEVPMRRLDSFIDSNGLKVIELLKIDVEGYEQEVLDGLGERIAVVNNIIFEVLSETGDEKNSRVINYLRDAGFSLFDVDGREFSGAGSSPENNVWARREFRKGPNEKKQRLDGSPR
jgi:FkbM family methyltransferase